MVYDLSELFSLSSANIVFVRSHCGRANGLIMKSMNFNEEGNFITLRELPAGMAYLGAVKLEHNLWVAIKEIDFPR